MQGDPGAGTAAPPGSGYSTGSSGAHIEAALVPLISLQKWIHWA